MSSSLLCIAFFALNTAKTSVPQSVQKIAKERLQNQFQNTHEGFEVHFDDAHCQQRGTYEFKNDSLSLNSEESPLWTERREYALSDLIEGRKLDFPIASEPKANPLLKYRSGSELSLAPTARIALGALIGGIGGAVGGSLFSPNLASRSTNAWVFGVSGALSGGLLTWIW